MGMPVKLSDDLVRAARAQAEATDRSITSQIEHWAKLGRAVEIALPHGDALALKVDPEATSRFARVRSVLERVARSDNRDTVLAELAASGLPLYEADPQDPEGIIQVDREGGRVAGRFEGRRFVPNARKIER